MERLGPRRRGSEGMQQTSGFDSVPRFAHHSITEVALWHGRVFGSRPGPVQLLHIARLDDSVPFAGKKKNAGFSIDWFGVKRRHEMEVSLHGRLVDSHAAEFAPRCEASR